MNLPVLYDYADCEEAAEARPPPYSSLNNVSVAAELPEAPVESANSLFDAVYDRLKLMSRRELSRSRRNDTLDTTALVHETYIKVCGGQQLRFSNSKQFFFYAARAMRHILIDRARYRIRLKGIGTDGHIPLSSCTGDALAVNPQLALDFDSALNVLEARHPRVARVVELHYFAGLTLEDVAQTLGVVRRTVDRDWRYARAFLGSQMQP